MYPGQGFIHRINCFWVEEGRSLVVGISVIHDAVTRGYGNSGQPEIQSSEFVNRLLCRYAFCHGSEPVQLIAIGIFLSGISFFEYYNICKMKYLLYTAQIFNLKINYWYK